MTYRLDQLATRGPKRVLIIETCLEQVLGGAVIVHLRNLLEIEIKNLLLNLDWVFSIKRIPLVQDVKQTGTFFYSKIILQLNATDDFNSACL